MQHAQNTAIGNEYPSVPAFLGYIGGARDQLVKPFDEGSKRTCGEQEGAS